MTDKFSQEKLHSLLAILLGTCALLAGARNGWSQTNVAPLFPRPFVVDHAVFGRSPGGTDLRTQSVTDYYGGSWIVSVRPDTSRLVVDFDRREITEIKPKDSTYSVVSFDGFAELRRRLRRAQQQPTAGARGEAAPANAPAAPTRKLSFTFEELTAKEGSAGTSPAVGGAAKTLAARVGVRHLRVSVPAETAIKPNSGRQAVGPSLEVWLDPTVTLGPPALAALGRFNGEVLNSGAPANGASFSAMLTAAREQTGGAFPIRTLHPATLTGGSVAADSVEDLATRLDYVDRFPADLLKVPSGYRRVAHPLEAMVAYLEAEALRARAATKDLAKQP